MESDQGKEYQSGNEQADRQAEGRELDEAQESVEVVPGAPVVRDNTPRPLSFSSLLAASEQGSKGSKEQAEMPAVRPTFPRKAPSAPPLPEELEDSEREESATGDVEVATLSDEEPQEFIWLFEYGPEMDSSVLNSVERLDGAAFLYGPAVLRGYTLMFAEVARSSTRRLLATIVPSADPDAEVWGVLYRIPRHVTVRNGSQP
ncbi:MAG TPA: gamma-glutamylcyclotransferase family protein, partial [Ktedonobacteraceae bacterium]|nr:gamma-glutamylcyclotransferase family protein [Ktedonobacteraceae bacterium]